MIAISNCPTVGLPKPIVAYGWHAMDYIIAVIRQSRITAEEKDNPPKKEEKAR